MRLPTILALIAATGLLGAAVAACAAKRPPQNENAETLLKRLRALEAESTCSATADCRTLPIGEKMCGGPSAWLAMSTSTLPEAQAVAGRYTALRQAANAKAAADGVAGTCDVVPEPAVACVAGYCRVQRGPSGRAD